MFVPESACTYVLGVIDPSGHCRFFDAMPLEKGNTREAISRNIATEERAGKPPKQAAAIAFNVARGDARLDALVDAAELLACGAKVDACLDAAAALARCDEGDRPFKLFTRRNSGRDWELYGVFKTEAEFKKELPHIQAQGLYMKRERA
jgi:hypothetical protein